MNTVFQLCGAVLTLYATKILPTESNIIPILPEMRLQVLEIKLHLNHIMQKTRVIFARH